MKAPELFRAYAGAACAIPASCARRSTSTAPERSLVRFVPSPRAVFTLLAFYGAFGNALVQAAHLSGLVAAFVAVLPALAVERFGAGRSAAEKKTSSGSVGRPARGAS